MTPNEHDPTDARASAARVLVVDPDGPFSVVLVTALGRAGHQALCVHTAAEAREMLDTPQHGVTLVISEMALPDGRGSDLLTEISLSHRQIRAMLMTSDRTSEGALLIKPFYMADLIAAVNHALGRSGIDLEERGA